MLNKSIRLTKEDVIGLNEIITQDPRIEKGQSEALYYSFKDAATNIPNWLEVAKAKFEGDNDIVVNPEDISIIRTFNIEREDFDIVRNSINEQLKMSRPRISYMTRLCILAARVRLKNKNGIDQLHKTVTDVKVTEINGVSLIRKITELLEEGATSLESKEKIMRIKEILEG